MARFIISDTHFDHKNIIDYTNRPFENVEEMNNHMIESWNNIVEDNDVVVHVGDFAMANQNRVEEIISKLNGKILLIKGNHDNISEYTFPHPYVESTVIQHKGYRYYCSHKKEDIPDFWKHWNLVGHTHNDDPFINYNKKLINISVECIGYKPLPLDILDKCLRSMSKKSNNIKDIHKSNIKDYEWYHENHI